MSLSPLIDDGYEFEGQVPAAPKLYDALSFRYRPALADEVIAYHRGQGRGTPKQELQHTTEFLSRHVVALDVVDRKGQALKPTADTLARCYHAVLLSLVQHVCGYVSPRAECDANEKN